MPGTFERQTIWSTVGLALLCIAAVAAVVIFWGHPEPRYNGRSLTEWLRTFNQQSDSYGYPKLTAEAEDAVRHIGTNGIPFYLRWLRYNPDTYIRVQRVPARFRPMFSSLSGLNNTEQRMHDAIIGFRTLGPLAASAIPELSSMMVERKKGNSVAFAARFALAYLGKDALPPLLKALTNTPSWDQVNIPMAIAGMDYLGRNVEAAVPFLIQSTTSTVPTVASESAYALGHLKLEPELSIAALTNCLQSSNVDVRNSAARALGEFGLQARPAIPALVQTLRDPDRNVRGLAYLALRRAAPDLFPGITNTTMDKGIEAALQHYTNRSDQ